LQSRNAYPLDDDADARDSSLSGGSGGGPSGGGGGGGSKRKDTGGEGGSLSGKGKKKARKVSGAGDGTRDCGEPGKASGELIIIFRLPLRPSCNIDFPLHAQSQDGQSHHREIASSSHSREDEVPVQSIDTGRDNSDSESGCSECFFERSLHFTNRSLQPGISAISPHDEDNPDKWRFGPSFSTNKTVFTTRAVNLT